LADDVVTEQHLAIDGARPAVPLLMDGGKVGQIPVQRDCSLKEIVQHNTATVERGVLARVLRETGGNKAEAARLLHIDYKTIQLKIKVYGLQTDRARKGDC
jgi:two-component system nitrogen regulation response regulator GlnG